MYSSRPADGLLAYAELLPGFVVPVGQRHGSSIGDLAVPVTFCPLLSVADQ